jgi:NADH dehydrogenase [ubiquinone] 1 alpha subcomplex assembly factor 7
VTSLSRSIARRINLQGPISIADFMAEALGHPQHGYYMGKDPFGRTGDFITAPEINQMFGELVGLWCAEVWRLMGSPAPFNLIELGPGRGTLMQDALRAARVLPDFTAAASVHLVETSPVLRDMQAVTLGDHHPAWHDDLTRVPDGPLIVIANEFFDALPVHQFIRTGDGWRENVVTVDADQLVLMAAPAATAAAALLAGRKPGAEGDIAEICPAAISISTALAERIAEHGGAALAIDYGYAEPAGAATLQAVRRHERHDFLSDPGTADLTAHVSFQDLRDAARPHATVYGPVTQGDFLRGLGIELRAEQLMKRATADQRTTIEGACRRLIDPAEMGTLFKALAFCHRDMPAPPAFETAAISVATTD